MRKLSKSIKLKDETYWDSTGIVHNKELLSEILSKIVSSDTLPIGAIIEYPIDTIPDSWLLCNGQAISRTDYAELFAVLGTLYGEGDGSTTFNLPNFKGRVAVGKDDNDSDFSILGKIGGEKTHTLTNNEMPKHYGHLDAWAGSFAGKFISTSSSIFETYGSSGMGWDIKAGNEVVPHSVSSGNSESHNNLQPYIATNFIIKAKKNIEVAAKIIQEDGEATEGNVYSAAAVDNKLNNGKFATAQNQYLSSGNFGIDMKNSDIINANAIWMNDESTTYEGMGFLKQGGDKTNPEDYEMLRGYRSHLYYDDNLIPISRVGDIVITSTNTNPASDLGGTWELVDKEFKSNSVYITSDEYVTLSDGCKSVNSGTIFWNDHSIKLLVDWTNAVQITDNEISMWTFNLAKLGISTFRFANRFTQFSDGGNVLIAYYCTNIGEMSTRDVIRRNSTAADLPAETAITAQFEWMIRGTDMLDSFCDKFYWKRTA